MSDELSRWLIVGLDFLAIGYTLWVFSLGGASIKLRVTFATLATLWIGVLYLVFSSKSVFPANIPGFLFLLIIVLFVGIIGALLFLTPAMRYLLLNLDQKLLLLAQGIRVVVGATFLMWAGTGILPQTFGTLDGWTHIMAGFLGLLGAFVVLRNPTNRAMIWVSNLFGLADILVVASTLSLVLLPEISPYHPIMLAVFLPAPLWVWFHLVSLWKLLRHNEQMEQKPTGLEVLA